MVIRLRLETASTTKGLYVSLAGPTKVTATYSLAQGSKVCTIHTGYRICVIEIHVDSGNYTGTVAMYDEAPISGHIPSSAKLLAEILDAPFTFVPGLNEKRFSIGGIPKTLIVTLPSVAAGAHVLRQLSVVAEDSSGAAIIGPYKVPITLTDGDATGNTSVSTSGGDHPPAGELLSSLDVPVIHYSGLAFTTAITITASATGATSGHATFAPVLQPIVFTSVDALNPNYVGVDLFATSGPGSSVRIRVSEAGWTNSPFDKTLTIAANSNPSIATVAQASGVYTASLAGGASPGFTTVTFSDPFNQQKNVKIAYTSFAYTGATQSIPVPAGVTKATIEAAGAQGATGCASSCGLPSAAGAGGSGGTVQATIALTQATLGVLVGGQGVQGTSSTGGAGGFNGGGNGAYGSAQNVGSGGGGASSVVQNAALLVVAGGGGGGADNCTPSQIAGGSGGYPSGASGGSCLGSLNGGGGGGGGQSSGGLSGTGASGAPAGNGGAQGSGGAGATCDISCNPTGSGGGGGGGGYWGGGGGGASPGAAGGSGGGGSSYYVPGATAVTTTNGTHTGNGSVVIIW